MERKGGHVSIINQVRKDGFIRIRVNNEIYPIDEIPQINKIKNSIDVVIDRLKVDKNFEIVSQNPLSLLLKLAMDYYLLTFFRQGIYML